MSDLHAINEAINKRAGRKLIPSIIVGLFLLAVIFSTMAFIPPLFALFVGTAVLIALHELTAALKLHSIALNYLHLALSTGLILGAAWIGGLPGSQSLLSSRSLPIFFLRLCKEQKVSLRMQLLAPSLFCIPALLLALSFFWPDLVMALLHCNARDSGWL